MKRPQFIASLVALCAAPFVSVSKPDKAKLKAGDITYAGRVIEPQIFRETYRVSKEEVEQHRGAITYGDDFIEKQCTDRMMYNIRNSSHLRKAKVMHTDGSIEFHYLLQLLPNG